MEEKLIDTLNVERSALVDKIHLASKALERTIELDISEKQEELLKLQVGHMQNYAAILASRIMDLQD